MDIMETETIQFTRYTGKVLAIMNVATFWGLNRVHYTGMNALKQEFPSGFEVLGFPCNEFYMVSIMYFFYICGSFLFLRANLFAFYKRQTSNSRFLFL